MLPTDQEALSAGVIRNTFEKRVVDVIRDTKENLRK